MRRIRSTDLAIFLAIAQHRSFRKAAVELGVTASALSHSLRAIEERLDVRLVNRTTRGVGLTEAGERLFERIRPAFLDIDDALEDLDKFRGQPYGKLRINAPRPAAKMVLLPIVSRFLRAYPAVEMEIVADDALVDTVSGGFDAGVRFGESIAADMIAIAIGPRQRTAIVGSPEHFQRFAKPVTPHDLKDHPCIRYRFPSGTYYRWEFERGGIELEIEVQGPLTLGDLDMMFEAAVNGSGLAFMFEDLALPALKDGRLIRVLEDWCPYYPGFFLYYPSRRQLPTALRAFVDFIKIDSSRQG
ncbi:LysR family transcriptional regulator [Rhizobium sp. CB3171]|uniref:LysR family transcriptional regulator n=1 Tax=unclassified Rhizobium TaxID=2613769 RepID=UPI000CDF5086|nr:MULTISPECIES: LysR family transcriptional regulator [Rhizobium]AVA21004.1 LysR family transcriptional regulator protein [Rhizobium sp. NXC24]MDK4739147.1 LysR family transcriptional regulator [Rhizobium sp. CNPSo 3464]UWU22203.1 LysR family transcriptional regulator [Rhizobium tropici]WFU03018.1 LysR family transcriptional regulator [Rhizobium sp. CB3171]